MSGAARAEDSRAGGAGTAWLASYPKAGNTWMRLLLMHALNPGAADWTPDQPIREGGTPISICQIEASCLLDATLLTLEEADLLRPRLYDALSGTTTAARLQKTHDSYRFNHDGVPVLGTSVGQSALYLVRDPRDVALSLAAFWNRPVPDTVATMNNRRANLAGYRRKFPEQIVQHMGSWSDHVLSWLDQDRVPVLTIRYEDLRAEPGPWLARALDFLGLAAAPADIARAVHLTGFARLQRGEAAHGFIERGKAAKTFFRRAQPGEWREALAPDLAASLVAAHRPVMERLGYDCA